MRIVIALGGNALIQRHQPLEAEIQKKNVAITAKGIATLIRNGHQVLVCHGNGPQIGLLALQSESYKKVQRYPFDVLSAESQSQIGYMLQQAIQNEIQNETAITVVTQVEIDPEDPAFNNPEKFIGPGYSEDKAKLLLREHAWTLKKDGDQYRRMIASPMPKRIIEFASIKTLVNNHITVICCGGGGIPVKVVDNQLVGVEAVIDKDQTAALLAEKINADRLIILTDVPGVYHNDNREKQKLMKIASSNALKTMPFAAGSMGPKIDAACRFANRTKQSAAIGAITDLNAILEHKKGTEITSSTDDITFY